MKKITVILCIVAVSMAFTESARYFFSEDKPVYIPPSKQRDGDAKKGYVYLTTGDYLKSGIPYNYFKLGFGRSTINYLDRDSLNKDIPYEYTAVKAFNGEIVIAPNCLQCHAQVFENKLVIGLGNTTIDFSGGQKLNPQTAISAEKMLKNLDPNKYEAAEPFLKVVKAIGSQLYTKVRGVNSADRLAALLAAHRDPKSFRWNDTPMLSIPEAVIPTDVPPWWLLKKKNAMFYNGFGRGDFGRFLMASNLLTVNDTSESREVDGHFNDVLAYIYSLMPPVYPKPVDKSMVKQGGQLYIKNCSKCHGNNGEGGSYPNLLIPESTNTNGFLIIQKQLSGGSICKLVQLKLVCQRRSSCPA